MNAGVKSPDLALAAAIDEVIGNRTSGGVVQTRRILIDDFVRLLAAVGLAPDYRGNWDASTNTPAIPAASSGNKGQIYTVEVAGSTDIGGITTWGVGDWLMSTGSAWRRVPISATIASKADDSAVVKLTGNQSIAGTKTFSAAPVVPDAAFAIGKVSGLQDALDATVKLTGNQTVAGVKTFGSSPVIPTPGISDSSTKAASTAFVATALSEMIEPAYVNRFPQPPDYANKLDTTVIPNGAVKLVDQADLVERGFTHGIQWPVSGQFARATMAGSQNGKKVFGAFYVYSATPSNISGVTSATVTSVSSIGALTNLSGATAGYVDISPTCRLVWRTGTVAAADSILILGTSNAPADATRYATGFTLYVGETDFDTTSILRQLLLRDQARRDVEAIANAGRAELVLNGPGEVLSWVESASSGALIRNSFYPFLTPTAIHPVFQLVQSWVNGKQIRSTLDDVAPYNVLGTTIGANHGYLAGKLTATGHGKDVTDVGSVWANGGTQYVITKIVDANTLLMSQRSANAAVPSGTFTHVSGAAHTGNIVASATAPDVFRPPFQNYRMEVVIDGRIEPSRMGRFGYDRYAQFRESYDILEKSELVAWLEANGASGATIPSGLDAAIRVTITYEFDRDAQLTIYTDFLALKAVDRSFIMWLQAAQQAALDEIYVPKALPFTVSGVDTDFAMFESATISGDNSMTIDFTPARCEDEGILCDRVITRGDDAVFAMGFLPVGSTAVEQRRTEATVRALQIASTNKVYMSGINKGNATMAPGEYYSTIGYRNIAPRSTDRTAFYAVRTQGVDYLYADWHEKDGIDVLAVPSDLVGRGFSVVEAKGATLLSAMLGGSISVDVDAASSYAYLILKVE